MDGICDEQPNAELVAGNEETPMIMSRIQRVLGVAVLSLMAGAGLAAEKGAQTSQCKGLSQAACGGNASCTWVDGYTTKAGRDVSGYCRVTSGDKSDGAVRKGQDDADRVRKADQEAKASKQDEKPGKDDKPANKDKKDKKDKTSGADGEKSKKDK